MTDKSSNIQANERISGIASIDVVVGGQFGSEAKGHVTQQVIRKRVAQHRSQPVLNIRVAGPNAGHTVYADVETPVYTGDSSDEHGMELRPFAFRQLPVGIVEDAHQVYCGIAAGSEIEVAVLLDEIRMVKEAGLWPDHRVLVVDPEATLLVDYYKEAEHDLGLVNAIGSTGKGIGAARADRIMRAAKRLADAPVVMAALRLQGVIVESLSKLYAIDPLDEADGDISYQVVIEGTQGYGLGLHAGHYPQTTSSDCRAIDFLAMAGVNPWAAPDGALAVWVVVRPYPIRVAGNSGALKDETTWGALDLPTERTTVTRKVRRVGAWDPELARDAVIANGGGKTDFLGRRVVRLALTMADQLSPKLAGQDDAAIVCNDDTLMEFIERIQTETGALVDLVTTSPSDAVWLV